MFDGGDVLGADLSLCWSECRPGAALAGWLEGAPVPPEAEAGQPDGAAVDGLERVGAWEREIAWCQAQQVRELAGVVARGWRRYRRPADREPELWQRDVWTAIVAEVGLMLRVPRSTAGSRVGEAVMLTDRVPSVVEALGEGRISYPTARMLGEETLQLAEDQAEGVARRVLAEHGGHTTATMRAAVRRGVAEADPEAVRRRERRARADRDVQIHAEADGMAELRAYLPAGEGLALFAVVDECARRAASAGDERTHGARRADALVDAVLGPEVPAAAQSPAATGAESPAAAPACADAACADAACADAAGHAAAGPDGWCGCGCRHGAGAAGAKVNVQVRVTVPFSTLLGMDRRPGELAGYGPISAETARELATEGTWRRILTDPVSGAVLDVGTRRYRPPAGLAEHVVSRDQRCDFPGCRVPAHRCDLEHTVPYGAGAGSGPTSAGNLRARCRSHHRVKQMPGWSVATTPEGGAVWRTPLGHEYLAPPIPAGPAAGGTDPPASQRYSSTSFPEVPPF